MKRLIVLACISVMVTACVSNKTHDKVLSENKYMGEQLTHYRNSVKRIETQLVNALGIAEGSMAAEKMLREWISKLEGIVEEGGEGYDVITARNGDTIYRVENTLLFSPGSIEISAKAIETISILAGKLKSTKGLIRIDGHTDNQPIKNPSTKAIAADNMELSVKRALAVRKILISKGVNASQVFVSGFGSFQPIAKNSGKGNPDNRRVDIVVMANSKVAPIKTAAIKVESDAVPASEPVEEVEEVEEEPTTQEN